MWMESGRFGGDMLENGFLSGVFEARVIIPESEFERLGLGDHEHPSSLPACFRWCHMTLGLGGTSWSVTLRDDTAVLICFAKAEDGLAFLARWAVDAAPARHEALAA
ncbi:hypothetical protein [Siccirubricoccus sp. G192]|uniref:hypothetical protein n=1 Tax=Siccirubricoccus sp. G192 TaxID=2849651 RepID=UPI001C2C2BE0|nr:hypothetical protein [Siccirubricoccus sp. G192]MBV1799146.1 hypothetical protein [Siccirubricoccus sp. G192]